MAEFEDYVSSSISVLTVQNAVLQCIVEALIDSHPKPDELQNLAGAHFARLQSGPQYLSAPPEYQEMSKALFERLFQKPA